MDALGKWLDWIRLTPFHYFVSALASGLVLLLPEPALSRLGLAQLPTWLRSSLGIVFVLSVALLLAHTLALGLAAANRWIGHWRNLRRGRSALRELGGQEKQLLRRYLKEDTQTQIAQFGAGVANGLEAKGILYRSSSISRSADFFAYNIQPWAWREIKRHPDLVEDGGRRSRVSQNPHDPMPLDSDARPRDRGES